MVGENQVGSIFLKFADEILSCFDSYGAEGEAVFAQFTIDHHHVSGDVLEDQDAQFFVHSRSHFYSIPS